MSYQILETKGSAALEKIANAAQLSKTEFSHLKIIAGLSVKIDVMADSQDGLSVFYSRSKDLFNYNNNNNNNNNRKNNILVTLSTMASLSEILWRK